MIDKYVVQFEDFLDKILFINFIYNNNNDNI